MNGKNIKFCFIEDINFPPFSLTRHFFPSPGLSRTQRTCFTNMKIAPFPSLFHFLNRTETIFLFEILLEALKHWSSNYSCLSTYRKCRMYKICFSQNVIEVFHWNWKIEKQGGNKLSLQQFVGNKRIRVIR